MSRLVSLFSGEPSFALTRLNKHYQKKMADADNGNSFMACLSFALQQILLWEGAPINDMHVQ
jgi:hypothetical protein